MEFERELSADGDVSGQGCSVRMRDGIERLLSVNLPERFGVGTAARSPGQCLVSVIGNSDFGHGIAGLRLDCDLRGIVLLDLFVIQRNRTGFFIAVLDDAVFRGGLQIVEIVLKRSGDSDRRSVRDCIAGQGQNPLAGIIAVLRQFRGLFISVSVLPDSLQVPVQ